MRNSNTEVSRKNLMISFGEATARFYRHSQNNALQTRFELNARQFLVYVDDKDLLFLAEKSLHRMWTSADYAKVKSTMFIGRDAEKAEEFFKVMADLEDSAYTYLDLKGSEDFSAAIKESGRVIRSIGDESLISIQGMFMDAVLNMNQGEFDRLHAQAIELGNRIFEHRAV